MWPRRKWGSRPRSARAPRRDRRFLGLGRLFGTRPPRFLAEQKAPWPVPDTFSSSGHGQVCAYSALPRDRQARLAEVAGPIRHSGARSRYREAPLPAKVVTKHRELDLAQREARGHSLSRAVKLAEHCEIVTNRAVFCHTHGSVGRKGRQRQFAPIIQFGDVTLWLGSGEILGSGGEDVLELSFPDVCGATAAPGVSDSTAQAWGILIQSVPCSIITSD